VDVIPEEKEPGKDKEQKDYKEQLQCGRYYLMPSFFSLMRALKKAKRDYAIVFRSFDNDLPNVIAEFNALCEGKHLCYNGVAPSPLAKFDGSKGNKDFRITNNKGILYRFENMDDTAMIVGTLDKVTSRSSKSKL
jgi:hypothetical protein